MSAQEQLKKPQHHPPRRYPPRRPPPGTQKALSNFGVTDLRELLDKKHRDEDKPSQKVPPPPPDPTYNYLRDPSREAPSKTQQKVEKKSVQDRLHHHHTSKNTPPNKDKDDSNSKKHQESANAPKKELRFADTPEVSEIEPNIRRKDSFRGRNNTKKSSSSKPNNKDEQDNKIENPINIKVELSTETGRRNCMLDESTRIADIKHVPDHPSPQKNPRGGYYRGGRGNFKYRGRGRNNFRKSREEFASTNSERSAENEELPAIDSSNTSESTINKKPQHEQEDSEETDREAGFEHEESEDINESYEEEDFPQEHLRLEEAEETVSENVKHTEETDVPKFEAELVNTMTITSSKYQDGDVKRSVQITADNISEKNGETA